MVVLDDAFEQLPPPMIDPLAPVYQRLLEAIGQRDDLEESDRLLRVILSDLLSTFSSQGHSNMKHWVQLTSLVGYD
jgi:hypothetical protein